MADVIKNIVSDLRITDKNKHGYLSVDDNYNLFWTTAPSESAGEVWKYTEVTETCYIILPKASLNQNLCLAILRGKIPDKNNPANSNNLKDPGVIILPNLVKNGNELENVDRIQGVDNIFYRSVGVNITNDTISYESAEDGDSFSSIIFKSVCIDTSNADKDEGWSWVVINGVGTWRADTLNFNLYDSITKEDSDFKQVVAPTQTSGVISLSSSIGSADVTFKQCVEKTNPVTAVNLYKKNNGPAESTSSVDLFSSNGKNLSYYFTAEEGTYYVFAEEDWSKDLKINALTQKAYNRQTSTNTKYTSLVKNLSQVYLPFGRIFGASTTDQSWADNTTTGTQKFCITKNLGRYNVADENSNADQNVIGGQWRFHIDTSDLKTNKGEVLTNIRNLLVNITSEQEDSRLSFIVYKTNTDGYRASDEIIELYRSGILEDNITITNGQLISVPVLTNETEFDIVLEAFQQTSTIYSSYNNAVFSSFAQLIRFSFTIFGAECLKQVSLSPEVSFENFGFTTSSKISSYLSKSITGITVNTSGTYGELKETENTTGPKYIGFFNKDGYFKPNQDVSKTVFDYKTKTGKYNLVIDWANFKYTFNAIDGGLYVYSGELNIEDISLKDLVLNASSLGLNKLPIKCSASDNVSMNITHYRTVVDVQENGKFIETLCNYRCGWERAEEEWTTTLFKDGSEWDALDGKSKECIEPAHYQQTTAVGWENYFTGTNTSIQYNATFDTSKKALLPYQAWYNNYNPDTMPAYYWAIRPIGPTNCDATLGNNSQLKAFSNVVNDQNSSAAINQFCNLNVSPTISGTLFVDISLPFIGIYPNQLGTLVMKSEKQGDLSLVYDSGIMNASNYANTRANGRIHFTDKVSAGADYKYYILFYMIENGHTNSNEDNHGVIIAKRSYNMYWNSEISDFRTWFEQNSVLENNSFKKNNITTANLFGTMNNAGSVDGESFMTKFRTAMFDVNVIDNNTPIANKGVKTGNTGATFSFHAYVLREEF